MSTVLVTGGSGFVRSHVVLQLLNAGHSVRTTVKKEERVRAMLRRRSGRRQPPDGLHRRPHERLRLATSRGWLRLRDPRRVAVVEFRSEDGSGGVAAARDGSLRVLHAACDAKVKRVVMTSSCGAVYYGYPPRTEPFDETNWSNPDRGDMSAYVRSKLIAERAA